MSELAPAGTAIVTGAASGMGRRMVERLVANGRQVAAMDIDATRLESLSAASPLVRTYACDVSDWVQVAAVIAQIEAECGPVARLVHAAALMPCGSIMNTPAEQITRLMRVNYDGTVHVTKAVLPGMIARGAGEVVIFGSIAALALTHNMGPYSATKAALGAYVEVLTHELAGSGLDILLVCPPIVDTPLLDQMGDNGPNAVVSRVRTGHMMTPDQVIDHVERGLAKKAGIIYPGDAWMAQLTRRLAPGLLWRTMTKINQPK